MVTGSTEAARAVERQQGKTGKVEVSVVLPCLNEVETVAACVRKARTWFERAGSGYVVRSPYRLHEEPEISDRFRHPFRIHALMRFLKDTQ